VRALLHWAGEGPWDESIALDLLWTPTTEKQLAGVSGICHCAGAAHFRGLSQSQQAEQRQLNVNVTGQLLDTPIEEVASLLLA
jgi:hypothetical protein